MVSIPANPAKCSSLQNIHKGSRAFVIGNGPSLAIDDLEAIKNEITFAANKIYLSFPDTSFRPTYYAAVDPVFLDNFHKQAETVPSLKFFPIWGRAWIKESEDTYFFQEIDIPKKNGFAPRFSFDLQKGLYGGFTVTFTLMQLAFYMGIRKLYLLGIDHDYAFSAKRTCHPICGEVLVAGGETNHFHPDYRHPGEMWTIPQPDKQKKSYLLAKEVFETHQGQILNLSRGGKLDIFPRTNLEDILA